jgi:GT2 family glycosyltransferase
MITHCISTYRNLPYLKLAVESVRKYSYYKNAPFIIHSDEFNNDGTIEWLLSNTKKYNLTPIIKNLTPSGIGPGMNICAENVKTEYINFLHSDFYVTPNWDLELMKIHKKYPNKKLWVNSFRIEPNMFGDIDRPGTHFVPKEAFGAYYYDFNPELMIEYSKQLSELNDFEIPKGEGVSGMIKKEIWDEVGGNDDIFAPTSWDDMDLFLRMLQKGVEFKLPTKSIVWHFGARGSHRLEENNNKSSVRQSNYARINTQKFLDKWGGLPIFNEYGMIKGIKKI